jgi:hypothetical protein
MEININQVYNFPNKTECKITKIEEETVFLQDLDSDKEHSYSVNSFKSLISHRILKHVAN